MAITKAVPEGDGWFQVVNRRRSNPPPLLMREQQWRSRWPKSRNFHRNWRGYSSHQNKGNKLRQEANQRKFSPNGTQLSQRNKNINCAPTHQIKTAINPIVALFPYSNASRPSYRINERPLSINGKPCFAKATKFINSGDSNHTFTINSANETQKAVTMARKKNTNSNHSMHISPNNINTTHIHTPHPSTVNINTTLPTLPKQNPNLKTQPNVIHTHSYAHAAASIHYQPIRPLNTIQRYQNPPWQHFMEHDPWQAPLLSNQTGEAPPDPLPLPPEPNHPRWRGRCYNCLEIGHDQGGCLSHERSCANCWEKGHQARNCPNLIRFDPMRPRGNFGEEGLPPNRPKTLHAYIPETNQMKHDAVEFNRGLVVDARLRPHHTIGAIQSVLMSTCKSEIPFPVTHMEGPQYLLLLPEGSDRQRFMEHHTQQLQELGYVLYPWSPAINGYVANLKFKIWIELRKLSPLAWTIDHLVAAVSTFGVVLDHSSMTKVSSIERMFAVVAVTNLENIPHSILMWIRGIERPVGVVVHSWIEETIPLTPPIDTTPSEEFFKKVHAENVRAITTYVDKSTGNGEMSVQFDTLLLVWKKLEPGAERDRIEATLRTSPLFANHIEHIEAEIRTQQFSHGERLNSQEERVRKGKDKVGETIRDNSSSCQNGGGKRTRIQSMSENILHASPFPTVAGPHAGVLNSTAPTTEIGVNPSIIQISNLNHNHSIHPSMPTALNEPNNFCQVVPPINHTPSCRVLGAA